MAIMDLVAIFLAVGAIWVAVRIAAHWHERRPKLLDTAHLDWDLRGLIEFGKKGTHLSLKEMRSGDEVVLVRSTDEMGDCQKSLELRIRTQNRSASIVQQLNQSLTALRIGPIERDESRPSEVLVPIPGNLVSDIARLEAVLRVSLRALGHDADARYRIRLLGPADRARVATYYGWQR